VSVLDVLKPAPPLDEIRDESIVRSKYRYWRFRIFYSMYIGYAFYYFSRKSFTFAMPDMIQTLGLTKSDLGILGSILSLTYGLSKFLFGILADRSNPRYFMALGLIITGLLNIFFGLSSSILFFAIFWGLNGWFQGCGWPPCSRLLTHWYSQKERGRWWGAWNTSHNVGGAIIPLVVAFVAQHFGWRYSMFVPGALCIVAGLFLLNRLRDTPQSLGLPSIEKFKNDYPTGKNAFAQERDLTAKEILFEYVLKNPFIWILAFSYFFVYVIRTAINDWAMLFLCEHKHYSKLVASSFIFWFEIGGFLGSLTAGWTSDKIFGGRRGPINTLFCLGVIGALALFWFVPPGYFLLDTIAMFVIGFLIFGPQMLIGIACAELSHKKATGTATGLTSGIFAYLGGAAAGYPLGKITDLWGWQGFFSILGICGMIAVLLLVPLWNVKYNTKKQAEGELETPT
jgi:OPA family sugar phosphate sensor protein UhpC-like MFS transporter